ncbi:unnamed protein product [Chondrus crispus]|uniref:Uncharacterized protein n=1 Tax=Chondrus crispus TaxID=2769 RepID=R7QUR7_CHOCR|nr:unnamed protein product [Chondrus crispus]CDF41408.1 unnamed protein product [Chondrus crispus]|eukprot:XP_005711702.1 unnamed protein product [Chondrus crispus]
MSVEYSSIGYRVQCEISISYRPLLLKTYFMVTFKRPSHKLPHNRSFLIDPFTICSINSNPRLRLRNYHHSRQKHLSSIYSCWSSPNKSPLIANIACRQHRSHLPPSSDNRR